MFLTNLAINSLLVLYVFVCVFMCLVVLMQRSKQEGLGAAFGGSMMSDTFGAQTSQVLVKATVVLAAMFFILSISLARLYSYRESLSAKVSTVQQELMKPVTPAASTNAAPVTTPVVPPAPIPATSANPASPTTTNSVVPAAAATPASPTPAKNATPAAPAKPAAK